MEQDNDATLEELATQLQETIGVTVSRATMGRVVNRLKLTRKKNPAAYPKAINELKADEELAQKVELRQEKYLNNIVEQDHRGIKRLVNPGMGFGSFNTARRTLKGYEAMSMIRKGQIRGVAKGAVTDRVKFIAKTFRLAA